MFNFTGIKNCFYGENSTILLTERNKQQKCNPRFIVNLFKNKIYFLFLNIKSKIYESSVVVSAKNFYSQRVIKKKKELNDQSELVKAISLISNNIKGIKEMEVNWSVPDQMLLTTEAEVGNSLTKVPEVDLPLMTRIQYMQELVNMPVGDYLKKIYIPYAAAGSCGNTSNVVEDLIHPQGNKDLNPLLHVKDAVTFISILKDQWLGDPKGNWYCRIDAGGHSVVVEYNKGCFMVHQSFFGRYTLADNIAHHKIFPVEQFFDLLTVALSSNPIDPDTGRLGELGTKEQVAARRELFCSQAVHPDEIVYRITPHPVSSSTIKKRLEVLNQKGAEKWQPYKNEKMSKFLIGKFTHQDQNVVTYTKHGRTGSVEDLIKFKSMLDEEVMLVNHIEDCVVGKLFYLKRFGVTKLYQLSKIEDDSYVFTLFKEEESK